MKVNLNKVIATSLFSGFTNYSTATFSTTIAGQNIGALSYVSASATTPLNNTNAVTQVQIQLSGLDSFWRLLPGNLTINYPNSSAPNYQVEVLSYFKSGTLHVDTYVINQTGGTITIPTITINCRAFLFLAPF